MKDKKYTKDVVYKHESNYDASKRLKPSDFRKQPKRTKSEKTK